MEGSEDWGRPPNAQISAHEERPPRLQLSSNVSVSFVSLEMLTFLATGTDAPRLCWCLHTVELSPQRETRGTREAVCSVQSEHNENTSPTRNCEFVNL